MRDYLSTMDDEAAAGPAGAPLARVPAAIGPTMLERSRDAADGAHPFYAVAAHRVRARNPRYGQPLDPAPGGTALQPAADGLPHVLRGGRFTPAGTATRGEGRRFTGWADREHPFLRIG